MTELITSSYITSVNLQQHTSHLSTSIFSLFWSPKLFYKLKSQTSYHAALHDAIHKMCWLGKTKSWKAGFERVSYNVIKILHLNYWSNKALLSSIRHISNIHLEGNLDSDTDLCLRRKIWNLMKLETARIVTLLKWHENQYCRVIFNFHARYLLKRVN